METQLQDLVEEESPGENDDDRTFGDKREERTLCENGVDKTFSENNAGKIVGEKHKDEIFCESDEDRILTLRQLSPSMMFTGEREDEGERDKRTLLIDVTSFRWTCDVEIQI